MFLCIYVITYICLYVIICIYAHMYNMYICFLHKFRCVCVCVCTCICSQILIHLYIHICICMHVCMHVCKCTENKSLRKEGKEDLTLQDLGSQGPGICLVTNTTFFYTHSQAASTASYSNLLIHNSHGDGGIGLGFRV